MALLTGLGKRRRTHALHQEGIFLRLTGVYKCVNIVFVTHDCVYRPRMVKTSDPEGRGTGRFAGPDWINCEGFMIKAELLDSGCGGILSPSLMLRAIGFPDSPKVRVTTGHWFRFLRAFLGPATPLVRLRSHLLAFFYRGTGEPWSDRKTDANTGARPVFLVFLENSPDGEDKEWEPRPGIGAGCTGFGLREKIQFNWGFLLASARVGSHLLALRWEGFFETELPGWLGFMPKGAAAGHRPARRGEAAYCPDKKIMRMAEKYPTSGAQWGRRMGWITCLRWGRRNGIISGPCGFVAEKSSKLLRAGGLGRIAGLGCGPPPYVGGHDMGWALVRLVIPHAGRLRVAV